MNFRLIFVAFLLILAGICLFTSGKCNPNNRGKFNIFIDRARLKQYRRWLVQALVRDPGQERWIICTTRILKSTVPTWKHWCKEFTQLSFPVETSVQLSLFTPNRTFSGIAPSESPEPPERLIPMGSVRFTIQELLNHKKINGSSDDVEFAFGTGVGRIRIKYTWKPL